jgi:hypothetical protein
MQVDSYLVSPGFHFASPRRQRAIFDFRRDTAVNDGGYPRHDSANTLSGRKVTQAQHRLIFRDPCKDGLERFGEADIRFPTENALDLSVVGNVNHGVGPTGGSSLAMEIERANLLSRRVVASRRDSELAAPPPALKTPLSKRPICLISISTTRHASSTNKMSRTYLPFHPMYLRGRPNQHAMAHQTTHP